MLTTAHPSPAFMVEFAMTKSPASTASVHLVELGFTVTSMMPAPPTHATLQPFVTRASSTGPTPVAALKGTLALTATKILMNALKGHLVNMVVFVSTPLALTVVTAPLDSVVDDVR